MVGKKNVVKKDAGSFKHYILGEPKIGKTTLFKEFLTEQYGSSESGLLISIGDEDGHKLIDDLYVEEAYSWSEFVKVVDELVDNVEELSYKMIGLDTVDELVEIASDETLRIHFQRKGQRADSINSALGGWGAGQRMVLSLIKKQLGRLTKAGYGLFFIGHTKIRDMTEKNGEPYQILTGSLDGRFHKFFSAYVDVIAILHFEKSSDGDGDRWCYFRSDGFVDAGSRFPDVPLRVKLSGKNYIDAFNFGIKSAIGKESITDHELTRLAQEEESGREESGKRYSKEQKNLYEFDSPSEYIDQIEKEIRVMNKEMKREIRENLSDDGIDVTDYKNIEDLDILKHILRVVREVI